MKKELSFEEARKVLEQGKAVRCQLNNREEEIVRKISKLEYLYNLSKDGTQMCKIYDIPQNKVKLSNDEIDVSFDEAYKILYGGELIYYKNGEKEGKVATISELVELRRKYELRGKELILYWHE